jgi:5-formyltetrahydrofolate cyclo-ligase
MSLSEDKKALRKEISKRIKTYLAKILEHKSALILQKLELDPAFIKAKTVLLYWSLPDEVSTHTFIEKWYEQKIILLPVILNEKMEAHKYEGRDKLVVGRFNISQPSSGKYNDKIDLVIVPGRAFNTKGHRLGRGKGFYDAFLKDFKEIKIGICFDFQLEDAIPVEGFDIIMDKLISD